MKLINILIIKQENVPEVKREKREIREIRGQVYFLSTEE
jgi:hypothetical protein